MAYVAKASSVVFSWRGCIAVRMDIVNINAVLVIVIIANIASVFARLRRR